MEDVCRYQKEQKELEQISRKSKPSFHSQSKALFSGKVLVAEDNEGCQIIIKKILERFGLQVVLADDSAEAVEKAESEKFDVIFMDLRMPFFDGLQATAILQKRGVEIPIVAMSADVSESQREICKEAGFNDYLPKPLERQSLQAILERYCNKVESPA